MPSDSPPLLLSRIRSLFARREANLRESVEALLTEQEAPSVEQEGEQAEALGPHERALLRNVLKLRGATAYDVMLPRADIIALQVDMDFAQVLDFVQREGHSRYPVYGRELDDIQGMVHIKDVIARLGRSEGFSLRAILRKPLLVVPSVPVLDLLLRMRMERVHLALVVDEYGGIDGIVTIEDLVETIVGDISDEHDELAAPQIIERAEGVLELDARTPVEAFETRLGPVLTEEERASDIDTVGGLVFTLAGRVPAKGEIVSHPSSGLEFRVLDADARRIRRLRVRKPPIKAAAE
ncbi:hemolysin family protein [Sabulicella glaciei]|uniref:Hemolysin family protein n=1 Tax=Sabulicella glaciei TaxID=2984948 RepID=A0ABT3NY44_9PROT|nr:hemolysin family protein [Roseococcus sp. MDT2-1-1]MCW8087086.1 hemolysin family protein [Roseococcus sp. MDT2-1-1]